MQAGVDLGKGGNGLSGDTSPRLKPPVPGGTEGKRYSRKVTNVWGLYLGESY